MRELSELTYLQTNPVLLDDRKLQRVLPSLVKTPYPEGIRRTVAAYAARQGLKSPHPTAAASSAH